MNSYYCNFCNKTININSKQKHDSSKLHLYLTNYVIEEDPYHDVDLKNVVKIVYDCANCYKNKFTNDW